ncbi:MAG: 3'(2'),5'-bisphosphate nucleotidase CysQ [Pseudomonadales bacterium]
MLEELIDIVVRAGSEILDVYATAFEVKSKSDDSPLTEADLRAHRVIIDGLEAIDTTIPVISEESDAPSFGVRKTWRRYWLVDPLDGTREFVNRNGEFTVNVALIEDNEPILGVVGVPVQGDVYVGDVKKREAFRIRSSSRQIVTTRKLGRDAITVVTSRSHGGEGLERYLDSLVPIFGRVDRTAMGSSLKFCLLAEGLADFYPRLGPTSEWDIGAAQAVLQAAGGSVLQLDGSPLLYNTKASFLNPDFLAVGDVSLDWVQVLPPTTST